MAAVLTEDDLAHFPSPAAQHVIACGPAKQQYAELRLPQSPGRHPILMFIHVGCWLADYDLAHARNLAAAFTVEGFATWLIEYRRVGDPGGGWPGTFEDVILAATTLTDLTGEYDLDLSQFIVAGHSAGGQSNHAHSDQEKIMRRLPFLLTNGKHAGKENGATDAKNSQSTSRPSSGSVRTVGAVVTVPTSLIPVHMAQCNSRNSTRLRASQRTMSYPWSP